MIQYNVAGRGWLCQEAVVEVPPDEAGCGDAVTAMPQVVDTRTRTLDPRGSQLRDHSRDSCVATPTRIRVAAVPGRFVGAMPGEWIDGASARTLSVQTSIARHAPRGRRLDGQYAHDI